MDSHTVTIIKATCPECGMNCHFPDWQPMDCWNCGESLKDYTADDLRVTDRVWQMTVDPISGEPVMVDVS